MSEVIQKAARAIYESDGPHDPWVDAGDHVQARYAHLAIAAIEALREPTPAMAQAMLGKITRTGSYRAAIEAALAEGEG